MWERRRIRGPLWWRTLSADGKLYITGTALIVVMLAKMYAG